MSELAISLKNVSKCYKRYNRPLDRLKEVLLPGKSCVQEFWALRDINLEIAQGETVGIIGQNGSGKSTLLQIIAGTLTPTTGEVNINGRVSALLELGSGFNPEFTGRQNVFFNGQILGLTREEIEIKFEDIAAFAEIGDFIDQPIKTYSSGMVVRLAFAVVAHTEPAILIVDEALAVGDVKFQARCMKRIRQLKDKGVNLLFVSHDAASVKMLCKHALLMDCGRIEYTGSPKEVVNHYIALISSDKNFSQRHRINTHEFSCRDDSSDAQLAVQPGKRNGNKIARITNVQLLNLTNEKTGTIESGTTFKIIVDLETKTDLEDLVIGISVRNLIGLVIYGTNTQLMDIKLQNLPNNKRLKVSFIIPCFLNQGVYTLTAGLHSEEGINYDWIDEVIVFEVKNYNTFDGIVDMEAKVHIDEEKALIAPNFV